MIEKLSKFHLVYLATPYSKYPAGIDAAFIAACKVAAYFIRNGIKTYSPIAHTHPIAIHGRIDPWDHSIWLPFDRTMMELADAIVVAELPSWEISKGIEHEVNFFIDRSKPVFYYD